MILHLIKEILPIIAKRTYKSKSINAPAEVLIMTPKLLWFTFFLLGSFNALVHAQYGNIAPGPGYYGPQQPIIVRSNNDDDGLRGILPLLLILLLADGGFGGGYGGGFGGYGGGGCGNCGCGGCNSCGNTIPVPYPIPIPCNNPVITS